MKFWKPILLTTILFSAFVVTFFYTACQKDVCNNVTCYNGGSCNNGKCSCPTGYENSQCQTKSITRYLGVYAGYSSCNNSSQFIDTAFVYPDNSNPKIITNVWVVLNSLKPVKLHGSIQSTESAYSIIIPADTSKYKSKRYNITLESNSRLNIAGYDINDTPGDTIVNKCTFVGVDTATIH